MHVVSTNHIAYILHFNDNRHYSTLVKEIQANGQLPSCCLMCQIKQNGGGNF